VYVCGHAPLWQVACICLPRPPPDERFPALPRPDSFLSLHSLPFSHDLPLRPVAANAHEGQKGRGERPEAWRSTLAHAGREGRATRASALLDAFLPRLELRCLNRSSRGGVWRGCLTPRALVPNTSGLMCIIALPRESGCCPCLLAAGERQAADAASCTKRARSLSQHCTKSWGWPAGPLTICHKSMAVAPARPALRTDLPTTAMIGHDPKCLMVCWV
jgi:hypothetical protein